MRMRARCVRACRPPDEGSVHSGPDRPRGHERVGWCGGTFIPVHVHRKEPVIFYEAYNKSRKLHILYHQLDEQEDCHFPKFLMRQVRFLSSVALLVAGLWSREGRARNDRCELLANYMISIITQIHRSPHDHAVACISTRLSPPYSCRLSVGAWEERPGFPVLEYAKLRVCHALLLFPFRNSTTRSRH